MRSRRHPYTQALLSAIPVPRPGRKPSGVRIKGDIPSPLNPPKGCRFHTRCPLAFDLCRRTEPRLLPGPHGQQVACHLVHGATA